MAQATLPQTKVDWAGFIADYATIRDAIEAVFPDFRDFNARVKEPGGFRLTVAASDRVWRTPSGRANFITYPGLNEDPVAAPDTLQLTTLRSHDQYNTTIYSADDRYRGITNRRDVVFMNVDDLAALGLKHGDRVDVEAFAFDAQDTEPRRMQGLTAVAYDIARGSTAVYYPEGNGLVALARHDPQSGTPAYKSIPVRVTASEAVHG
jgi:anaerobic selenocysteine-containing dehydrogenase